MALFAFQKQSFLGRLEFSGLISYYIKAPNYACLTDNPKAVEQTAVQAGTALGHGLDCWGKCLSPGFKKEGCWEG